MTNTVSIHNIRKKVTDKNRMRYTGGQYYLKSPEEMSDLFKYAPQAIAIQKRSHKDVM